MNLKVISVEDLNQSGMTTWYLMNTTTPPIPNIPNNPQIPLVNTDHLLGWNDDPLKTGN